MTVSAKLALAGLAYSATSVMSYDGGERGEADGKLKPNCPRHAESEAGLLLCFHAGVADFCAITAYSD